MTRFDDPTSRSRSGHLRKAVVGVLSGNPGVVLATMFVTFLVLSFATALIGLAVAVPTALRAAFVASPILVFASPAATRGDVDALGARLKALPMVADATLRTKDVALSALTQAGLPAIADGRNPLPDVWTVQLRVEGARGGNPNFVSIAVGARDAIAVLPTVDQVKFEDGWANLLDRWANGWSTFGAPLVAVGLGIDAIAMFCLHGVFARATAKPSTLNRNPVLVLAIVQTIVFFVCGLLAYLSCALVLNTSAASNAVITKPIAEQLSLDLTLSVVSTAALGFVAAWIGTVAFMGRE